MRDDRSSYSELSTLADCEKKWWFRYLMRDRRPQTVQQRRGSHLHDLVAAWRQGDVEPAMQRLVDADLDPEQFEAISWVFDRYVRYYGPQGRPRVVANELKVESTDGRFGDITIETWVDEIVQVHNGGLWAVERKSMKDWRRLSSLDVDPQVSITVWNLQRNGWPIKGVLYDAIRTHVFAGTKPTQAFLKGLMAKHEGEKQDAYLDRIREAQEWQRIEEPLESSFRLEPQYRSEVHIAAALDEMAAGLARRRALAAGDAPMRNIGNHCDWCDYKYECWTGLEFNQDIEVV